MRVLIFTNALSLGGTEKAACWWARNLKTAGYDCHAVSITGGPRLQEYAEANIECVVLTNAAGTRATAAQLADLLRELSPDVIHSHSPGYPHEGDILYAAIKLLGKRLPVVQTNIFGRLENAADNDFVSYRLFISWTSCVQAARRAGVRLDEDFFSRQSVASYPVEDPFDEARSGAHARDELQKKAQHMRERLGISDREVLFGRFSRPEPNKWTDLPLRAFLKAYKSDSQLRLLLREPPPKVADELEREGLGFWFKSPEFASLATGTPIIMMPMTADSRELAVSQMACDCVLHGSSIGESFGYGIAELMALGKPVIANSVPWFDQAQIELVRPGECGYVTSTIGATADAISKLARSRLQRTKTGENARLHVLNIANPVLSLKNLQTAIACAVEQRTNPCQIEDFNNALKAACYLDKNQWGDNFAEQIYLRFWNARIRFSQWRRSRR